MSGDYYGRLNPDLLSRIPGSARRIVEVGCGAGALGAEVRKRNPDAHYLGVEIMEAAGLRARAVLSDVLIGDAGSAAILDRVPDGMADLLIFADVLEHLIDPWQVLAAYRAKLKPGGLCIACIPNIQHWSILLGLLSGKWSYADEGLLDRTHLRFFTIDSAVDLFRGAGFDIAGVGSRILAPEECRDALDLLEPALKRLNADDAPNRQKISTFQWIIEATRPLPESPQHL